MEVVEGRGDEAKQRQARSSPGTGTKGGRRRSMRKYKRRDGRVQKESVESKRGVREATGLLIDLAAA